MTELPRYCIAGARPVKAVRTPEGGIDVLAYDWATGELTRDLDYLEHVLAPADHDVEFVSEAEFEAEVRRLRAARRRSS